MSLWTARLCTTAHGAEVVGPFCGARNRARIKSSRRTSSAKYRAVPSKTNLNIWSFSMVQLEKFLVHFSRFSSHKKSRYRTTAALILMVAFLVSILSVKPAMAGVAIATATGKITYGTDVTGV